MNRTMFAKTLTNCTTTAGGTTITCNDTTGLIPGMVLVDTVNTTDGKPHEFCQNWIVPGDETNGQVHVYGFGKDQLSVNSAAHTVRTSDPEGPNLTMIHSGLNGGALHYIHHYGEKNPWRGWFSYGFGAFVPAHQIEVRFTATDSATLITVIHPRRTGETEEIAVSDLSPAGNLREAACRFTLPGNRTVTVHARKKLEFTVSGPSGSDGLIVTGRGVPGKSTPFLSPLPRRFRGANSPEELLRAIPLDNLFDIVLMEGCAAFHQRISDWILAPLRCGLFLLLLTTSSV